MTCHWSNLQDSAREGPRARLGPAPAATLRALADLGLSDEEIARYHGVRPQLLAHIRRARPMSASPVSASLSLPFWRRALNWLLMRRG